MHRSLLRHLLQAVCQVAARDRSAVLLAFVPIAPLGAGVTSQFLPPEAMVFGCTICVTASDSCVRGPSITELTGARRLPRVSRLTYMSFLPLNAFSVFLAIAAVGFLFLMISLFFGEIFEHFDGSLDHDLDHGGPGFFSTRVLSVFITAFGGFGAIATDYGLGTARGVGHRRRQRR